MLAEPGLFRAAAAVALREDVHDRAPEPKELVWIETHNHVELYDQQPYVPRALDRVVPWLDAHLAARQG